MDCNSVKPGLRVRTGRLEKTDGMCIAPQYLASRAEGKTGEVLSYVPGHGGDVWFVRHDEHNEESDVGAYVFTELEPL